MIILPSRKLWVPPQRQRGFIINPYAFGPGGGPTDPNYSNVTLLLNYGGADGSTTFTDSSSLALAVAANGNAQIDTSLGFNAGLLDGNGDYLSVAYNAGHDLTSGDWTIEGNGRYVATSGGKMHLICKDGVSGSSFPQYAVGLNASGQLYASVGSGGGTSYSQTIGDGAPAAVSAGTNFHWAFCNDAGELRLYVGGAQVSHATKSGSMTNNASKSVLIGYQEGQPTNNYWNGWQWGTRITKGVCRYPNGTTFTPPSAPLPTS